MKSLHVRAHLAEPVLAGTDGLHLDGILSYGYFMSLPKRERDKLPSMDSEWVVDFDLPIKKWEVDTSQDVDNRLLSGERLWGWVCTRELLVWPVKSKYEVRKRPEADWMTVLSGDRTLNIGGGPMKAHNLTYPCAFAKTQEWGCIGDKEEVERLLSFVKGIGKKCSLGMGKVMNWEVEEADFTEDDIILNRRMPNDNGFIVRGIRAPYHHFSRFVKC